MLTIDVLEVYIQAMFLSHNQFIFLQILMNLFAIVAIICDSLMPLAIYHLLLLQCVLSVFYYLLVCSLLSSVFYIAFAMYSVCLIITGI